MKQIILIFFLSISATASPVTVQDVQKGGTVAVTLCDCSGEQHRVLWPWLLLAAVPMVFIHGHEDLPTITITPTPNSIPQSTPNPVPESSGLLLLGIGLSGLATLVRIKTRTR